MRAGGAFSGTRGCASLTGDAATGVSATGASAGDTLDPLRAYLRAACTPPDFPSGPGPSGAVGKRYPGAPRVQLPAPSPNPRPGTTCDLRQLSDLLALSFGGSRLRHPAGPGRRSSPGLLRAVASGGALYPTELYLLHTGIAGLEDGLSHYDPVHHQLERLRPAGSTGSGEGPGGRLWLLLTSATWKTAYKYQAFSYRPLTLELGLLGEQLRTVGAALGAGCTAHPFPAAASELLGLTEAELPGLLLALEWPAARTAAPAVAAVLLFEHLCLTMETVQAECLCPGLPTLRDFPAAWHLHQAATRQPFADDDELPIPIALPGGVRPLVRAIRSRRSCTQGFRSVPVPAGQLQGVLRRCSGIGGVDLLVVARKVNGLAPGTYRYDPHTQDLQPTGTGQDSTSLTALLRGGAVNNLEQSSHPAAWVYPVVTLLPAERGGAGHYRAAQIAAGRVLQRLQLASSVQCLDSHISLAYDVAAVQRGFGLDELAYPAAQVLLGRALPGAEGLEVRL